jgi:hypothetical protein
MVLNSKRPEIDHHTLKLIVGLIAIFLPILTSFFTQPPLRLSSISASYWEGGWSEIIFVGFLFAISAFLLAYNGNSTPQMLLSKVAAFAALGVAMFPCKCGSHPEIIPNVHGVSATIMFGILAFFCYVFFKRARKKGHAQAKRRTYIYAVCFVIIVAVILTLTFDNISKGLISSKIVRLTFYGEGAALLAFGLSWLTASRSLPLITSKEERFSPFSD